MVSLPDEIRAIYAQEEASTLRPTTLQDVPHSYERITPEWMSAVLCRDAPGAQVSAVRLGESSHGSSNRQRIFVDYNQAGRDAGLPSSVFCKGSLELANRVMLGMSLTAKGEANFFNLIQKRLSVPTPPLIHAKFDDRTHGYVIVMEDLTGRADFCDETTFVDRARAEDMVRQLATLHGAFYESPELGSASIPFMHWADWWRHMTSVAADFGERCDVAFGDAESIIPARLFARRDEVWPLTMESAERHRGLPRSLIHCDVHLKNWFSRDGKMGMCDWQITSVGHWSRDFIYALSTALTVENRRAWLDDLLRLYLDELAARGGERIGFDEALRYCRQQLLSTLAFWTITLRPAKDMPPMQPDSTTLCFIERIAAAMDDLDALDSF